MSLKPEKKTLAQSVMQNNKLKRPSKEDYAKDIAMIKE